MSAKIKNHNRPKENGYFGIGIENHKVEMNIGTLWRSAHIMGASFIFTIGRKYQRQASDTTKAWRHVPLYHYKDIDQFYNVMPKDCLLIGVEILEDSLPIHKFNHPQRCIYLLGAESHGLTNRAIDICHKSIVLPGSICFNVAVAGSLVMYDRYCKSL